MPELSFTGTLSLNCPQCQAEVFKIHQDSDTIVALTCNDCETVIIVKEVNNVSTT